MFSSYHFLRIFYHIFSWKACFDFCKSVLSGVESRAKGASEKSVF